MFLKSWLDRHWFTDLPQMDFFLCRPDCSLPSNRSLVEFSVELSDLLCNMPGNGYVLDSNIQAEKLPDLQLLLLTHEAGNHLDLMFTRNCSTSMLTYSISYSLSLSQTDIPISYNTIPVCHILRSPSPSPLAALSSPFIWLFRLCHISFSSCDVSGLSLSSHFLTGSSWFTDAVRADNLNLKFNPAVLPINHTLFISFKKIYI